MKYNRGCVCHLSGDGGRRDARGGGRIYKQVEAAVVPVAGGVGRVDEDGEHTTRRRDAVDAPGRAVEGDPAEVGQGDLTLALHTSAHTLTHKLALHGHPPSRRHGTRSSNAAPTSANTIAQNTQTEICGQPHLQVHGHLVAERGQVDVSNGSEGNEDGERFASSNTGWIHQRDSHVGHCIVHGCDIK